MQSIWCVCITLLQGDTGGHASGACIEAVGIAYHRQNMYRQPGKSYLLTTLLMLVTSVAGEEQEPVAALPACDEERSSIAMPKPPTNRWEVTLKTEADIPAALAEMTLEEKLGQLVQTDIAAAHGHPRGVRYRRSSRTQLFRWRLRNPAAQHRAGRDAQP